MNRFSFSQSSTFSIKEWKKKFEAKNDSDNKAFTELQALLFKKDRSTVNGPIGQLEHYRSGNHYFKVRLYLRKALEGYWFGRSADQEAKFFEQALNEAYETGAADRDCDLDI